MSQHEQFWNWSAWLADERNVEKPFQKETMRRYNAHPLLVGNIETLEARVKVLEEALWRCLPFVELALTHELRTDDDKDQEALAAAREALSAEGRDSNSNRKEG